MAINKEQIHPGQPGYYEKNENRYRYCNDFHDEGYRCTRTIKHKPPHAAHIVMGVEGTVDAEGNVKPGAKNTENVQIATWL
jgi:hypothetical protein